MNGRTDERIGPRTNRRTNARAELQTVGFVPPIVRVARGAWRVPLRVVHFVRFVRLSSPVTRIHRSTPRAPSTSRFSSPRRLVAGTGPERTRRRTSARNGTQRNATERGADLASVSSAVTSVTSVTSVLSAVRSESATSDTSVTSVTAYLAFCSSAIRFDSSARCIARPTILSNSSIRMTGMEKAMTTIQSFRVSGTIEKTCAAIGT